MKSGLYNILDLSIFFLGLFSFFPFIRAISFFNLLWAVLLMILVLSIFLTRKRSIILKTSRFNFCIVIYIIYTVGVSFLSGNLSIASRFIELSQIPIFYLAFEHNRKLGRNMNNLRIIKLLSPFIILTSILTLKEYRITPFISRMIKSGAIEGKEIMASGVGGYEFIYFLVFLFSVLIFTFRSIDFGKHRKKSMLIMLLLTILISYNIVLSGYTIALFLFVISILFRLLDKTINLNKLIKTISLFILLFILFYLGYNFIIDKFLVRFEGTGNASKILEIISFFNSDTLGVSSQARVNVYLESISIFINNPFFGIIFYPLAVNHSGELIAFGQHSQIIDTFALFGISLGLLQLYIYTKPLKDRITVGLKKYDVLAILIMFNFLVITVFNNITPSIGFVVLFIYPTISEIRNKQKL
tara:strand:- start:3430 stop:4671 length:1242 start_codon:yes stop_codon:yes gene_type:complete